ncbi:MAG: hypothetical protein GX175_11590 [Halanaerobiaceae bacterium]|nr:hypothetical protein [Halanaerobiaceae bacterium]
MFGYVMPCKEELKVKEYNLFKTVYCGLCKTLGKTTNQLARFGLSYDFTFLALLLTALDEEEPEITRESCIANPFRKKPVLKKNKHLEYAAELSIIFVYLNLLDNWQDEHSLKSLAILPVYFFPFRKNRKKYNDKFQQFKACLERLTLLEKNRNEILDRSADVFAEIMSYIFTPDYIKGTKEERILAYLGYNLGRWIYILDAYSDIEEDIKNGSYNPLLLQYKYQEDEGLADFLERIKEPVEFTLTFTLSSFANSYQLLGIKRFGNILDNIIYKGLYRVMMNKLNNGGNEDEKSLRSAGNQRRSK